MVETLLSEDLVYEEHRLAHPTGDGAKSNFVAATRGFRNIEMAAPVEPLAVRGDSLALLEIPTTDPDGRQLAAHAVLEVDENRVATYCGIWDDDDLRLAYDELNRRWLRTLDETSKPSATFALDLAAAVVHADLSWLDAHVAADFVSVDHRPAGLGTRDRATFMAMVAQRPTTVGDGLLVVQDFLRCDQGCVIGPIESRTTPPGGGAFVSERHIPVNWIADGQLLRLDIYPIGERERALAAADAHTPSLPQRTAPDLANRATQTWCVELPVARTADFLLREDLVYEVNRRGVGGPGGGKRELQETGRSWHTNGFTRHARPVAIRGEHLTLVEIQFNKQINEIVINGVIEVDNEGRALYCGVWDDEDLQLAQDELNRRWLLTLNERTAALARRVLAFTEAIVHADLAWLDAHLAPEFVSIDHRPAGLGDRDRDTFIAMVAQRPTTVGDGVFIMRDVTFPGGNYVVSPIEVRTRPPTGGGHVSEQLTMLAAANGDQITRADIYPIEQPDLALAAVEALLSNQKP